MSSSSTTNSNHARMPTPSEHQHKELGSCTPTATQSPKMCLTCCRDEDLINLPCGHSWCPGCITLASSLVINERHWPIACGENCSVPEELALEALPKEDAESLKAKLKEFKTPARERCYCANMQCNKFILTKLTDVNDNLARCGECSTVTCTLCRREQHEGSCAGASEEETQSINLMAKEGYQQCTDCYRVVERVDGCPKITCYCGRKFCYHCGGDIKVCNGCWHLEPEANDPLPMIQHAMTHLQEGFNTMLAGNLAQSGAQNTYILNTIMRSNGYLGDIVLFDAQGNTLFFDADLGVSEGQVAISDVALWQMIRAVLEKETAALEQEETLEAEWDRIETQRRQEEREAREAREAEESWAGDWDM